MQRPLRRALRRSVAAFLVSATTFSLVPPPASAAGLVPAFNPLASATIVAAGQSVRRFREEEITKPPLSPLPFKAFDVTDPATKKPVDPDTTITAPSGQRVRAGDYWKQVNDFEQYLNARGQSLRNGTTFELGTLAGGTQAELLATHTGSPQIKGHYDLTTGPDPFHQTLNPATHVQTVTKPVDDDSQFKGAISAVLANIEANEAAAKKSEYGFKSLGLKPLPPNAAPPAPPSVAKTTGWSDRFGKESLAAVVLSGSVTTEAGKGHVGHVLANEGLTAYLIGQSASIISATGDGNPKAATFDFSALGDSFANYSGPITSSFTNVLGSSKNMSLFDFDFDVPVSIVTVTVGASANLNFEANAFALGGRIEGPSTVWLAIDPSVGLLASFVLGVGIGDTSGSYGLGLTAEVEGNLNIAQVTFALEGHASDILHMYRSGTLRTDKNIYACSLTFKSFNEGQLIYTFLSGNVDVKLKFCLVFCGTVFTLHLFSWSGITGHDTLFDQSTPTDGVPGSPTYSDLTDYGILDPGTAYSKDDASGMPQACDDLREDQQKYGASS